MEGDSQFLSSDQLFEAYAKRCQKPVYEPKKNLISIPSPEDEKYLQEKYKELLEMLSHPRVVKQGHVSIAEHLNGRILVTQKVGKWEKFGYSIRNEQYLYPHEALFLVEIKRLMITQNSMVLSLEECYKMFLTDDSTSDDKLTLPEYLVYATLTRSGLYVRLHLPIRIPLDDEEIIWNHLDELLKAPQRDRLGDSGSSKSHSMVQQMEKSRLFIENQSKVEEIGDEEFSFEWPTTKTPLKRKLSGWASQDQSSSKRFKRNPKESKLNVLKDLPEYDRLRDVFKQLEIIKLRTYPVEVDYQCSFHFKFDIFNPKSKHDKKTAIPSYRGIVCPSNKSPEFRDLIYLQQDIDPTPILIFHVDESMIIQSFMYEFE